MVRKPLGSRFCGNDEPQVRVNDEAQVRGNDEAQVRGNDEAQYAGTTNQEQKRHVMIVT